MRKQEPKKKRVRAVRNNGFPIIDEPLNSLIEHKIAMEIRKEAMVIRQVPLTKEDCLSKEQMNAIEKIYNTPNMNTQEAKKVVNAGELIEDYSKNNSQLNESVYRLSSAINRLTGSYIQEPAEKKNEISSCFLSAFSYNNQSFAESNKRLIEVIMHLESFV